MYVSHARALVHVLLCVPLVFGLPLQGTAADIVKTAMVLVARRLDTWRCSLEEGLDCPRLIMQVRTAPHAYAEHDSDPL